MQRIYSLDVLRGLAIFMMISIDAIHALPVEEIYPLLDHAEWEGLTVADLPFPAFMFAMGMSAAISMARREPSTTKILKRAAILFALGILFNVYPSVLAYLILDEPVAVEHLRIFGILQRLALVYLFGALLVRAIKNELGILAAMFLLLILSSAGYHIYAPDNPFAVEHNISSAIDLIFPGADHIYETTHDPEGLYGTLASVASFLAGYLTGKILISKADWRDKIIVFGASSVVFLVQGGMWSTFDIISKNLWTAPYALINAGIELFLLIALIYLSDKVPKSRKFLQPFCALGTNPLFFFLASNFLLIFLNVAGVYYQIYAATLINFSSPEFSSMIFGLLWSLLWIKLAEIFYRNKIVIKI